MNTETSSSLSLTERVGVRGKKSYEVPNVQKLRCARFQLGPFSSLDEQPIASYCVKYNRECA
jgi:hypothetical protein